MREQGGLEWSNILVSLWMEDISSTSSSTWYCVWEHAVDFTSVKPVGHHLAGLDHPPNSVYIALSADGAQRDYFRVGSEQSSSARERTVESGPVRQSYTDSALESVLLHQNKLSRLLQEQERLVARCGPALCDPTGLARKGQVRLSQMQQAVQARKKELDALRESLKTRQDIIQRRRHELQEGSLHLDAIASRGANVTSSLPELQRNLQDTQKAVARERARLLRDLDLIYPIQLEEARTLLYSIVALPLPNGVASTTKNASALVHKLPLEQVGSALAFVAQLVLLLSAYLHIPLPYPLTIIESKAIVRDGISIMNGPRAFVLDGRGTELYRYEYAVFLLNKNIEQLMNKCQVPVLDLRNTLPNLKNLLMTLSALPVT
ncbi:hypothetical protein MNAN1_000733 [Malassezia nana]|uniref:Autophagy-related protein 14 n=1 Tax=Malassezia nana TaxID=180528 RepID=A0AAF0EG25_9BASI|nr:hypothetical protein MNAN1_000733 [Malassezia nana]